MSEYNAEYARVVQKQKNEQGKIKPVVEEVDALPSVIVEEGLGARTPEMQADRARKQQKALEKALRNEAKQTREERFKDPSYVQELTNIFQSLQRGELFAEIDQQKLDDIEALIDYSKDVKEKRDKGYAQVIDVHTSNIVEQVLAKPKKVARPRAVEPRGSTRGRQDISPVKPPAPPEKKKGFFARLFG